MIEVMADYWCAHRRLFMPFYGTVSILIYRSKGTITEALESWPRWMTCEEHCAMLARPGKDDGKCKRVREERLERLTRQIKLVGLHDKNQTLSREAMEALARALGNRHRSVPKLSTIAGKVRGLWGHG